MTILFKHWLILISTVNSGGNFKFQIHQIRYFFSIIGICSNGKILLTASKVGFNPSSSVAVEIEKGSSRIELTLTKVSLPRLLINPQSKIRFVGQSARLCCSGIDSVVPTCSNCNCVSSAQHDNVEKFPLRIFWYKNEELLDEGEKYNQTSTDLKLKNIQKSDAGTYFCQVANNAGAIRSPKVRIDVRESDESTCLPPKVNAKIYPDVFNFRFIPLKSARQLNLNKETAL